MKKSKTSNAHEMISAVIWLSVQILLVSLLFFWPRSEGFGWPRIVYSYNGDGLNNFLRQGEFGTVPLNLNLSVYIVVSVVLLVVLSLLDKKVRK